MYVADHFPACRASAVLGTENEVLGNGCWSFDGLSDDSTDTWSQWYVVHACHIVHTVCGLTPSRQPLNGIYSNVCLYIVVHRLTDLFTRFAYTQFTFDS